MEGVAQMCDLTLAYRCYPISSHLGKYTENYTPVYVESSQLLPF